LLAFFLAKFNPLKPISESKRFVFAVATRTFRVELALLREALLSALIFSIEVSYIILSLGHELKKNAVMIGERHGIISVLPPYY
jgi:hypothetical protein